MYCTNICTQSFCPSAAPILPQNSRYQTYQRMWNYMNSKQPSVFVKSTEEGIARVVNSKYAFLMESTMNEYHRGLNCNLTQIGGLLDTKGYGIGMPLGNMFLITSKPRMCNKVLAYKDNMVIAR